MIFPKSVANKFCTGKLINVKNSAFVFFSVMG